MEEAPLGLRYRTVPAPPAPTPDLGSRGRFSPPARHKSNECPEPGGTRLRVPVRLMTYPLPKRQSAANRRSVSDRRLGNHLPPLVRQLRVPLIFVRAA